MKDEKLPNLIVKYSPEELWFNPEKPECEKFLKENWLKIPSPYIAIVRADGDYLGDLLEGKLTPYFSGVIDSNEYEDISQIRNKIDNFLKEYLIKSGGNEKIENKVKELLSSSNINYFTQILNEAKIIVTPAWHVAISAALNRSLIKEIELVNKYDGFVIYAGGDDLLAFLPVSNVVDFILESRRAFYGGYEIGNQGGSSNAKPFYKLNEAEYPQLAVIGRSYSVVFGRYKDPLSLLTRMSYSILENGKERIYFEKNGERYKKDVAIFVYQGSISYVPLFTNRIDIVKEMDNSKINIGEVLERALKEIYNKINSGDFSTSLLYDYYNYKDLIKSTNEDKYRRDIIKTWLSRNVKSKSLAKQYLDSLVEELLNLSKIETIDYYSSDEANIEEDNALTQLILTLKFLIGVS
ncbi:type III-B CRISPR-associated protein Cas10/Cmr2 [Acidianus sp. RZ1]|uniref:type III-B CRISPR-associated protein Cas10/Cmr2 n=1 Tax=Acidianus sp. RZ1 TaxID=1540082 RepID=UPI001490F3E8|nr:type III-B CRISPR-associated protein Cas10/Cmr2 [Acidianus sp. RZ1]NON61258.1 type III-B CRISPR-associated protein Cas10/Cmr2 [Acidianus sp. RZ1]